MDVSRPTSPARPPAAHLSAKAQGKQPETAAQAQARIAAQERAAAASEAAQRRTNSDPQRDSIELEMLTPEARQHATGNYTNRPPVNDTAAFDTASQLEQAEPARTNADNQDTGVTEREGRNPAHTARYAKLGALGTVATGAIGYGAYALADQIKKNT